MSARNIFKVTILGDGAVGKTAIRRRYLGEGFDVDYMLTIGADFAVKKIEHNDTDYNLVIWDLAGQLHFKDVREGYYKGTRGALLVYDVSRPESYENLKNWVVELYMNNGGVKIPMVLIGNKADLRGSLYNTVPQGYAVDYALKLSKWSGFKIPYYETSAKYGDNINLVFELLFKQMLKVKERESLINFI